MPSCFTVLPLGMESDTWFKLSPVWVVLGYHWPPLKSALRAWYVQSILALGIAAPVLALNPFLPVDWEPREFRLDHTPAISSCLPSSVCHLPSETRMSSRTRLHGHSRQEPFCGSWHMALSPAKGIKECPLCLHFLVTQTHQFKNCNAALSRACFSSTFSSLLHFSSPHFFLKAL